MVLSHVVCFELSACREKADPVLRAKAAEDNAKHQAAHRERQKAKVTAERHTLLCAAMQQKFGDPANFVPAHLTGGGN